MEIKDVINVEIEGNCAILRTEKKTFTICYPEISNAVLRGKIEITEFHRKPGHQEFSVYFDKPVTCEVTDTILRCPKNEKISWEMI